MIKDLFNVYILMTYMQVEKHSRPQGYLYPQEKELPRLSAAETWTIWKQDLDKKLCHLSVDSALGGYPQKIK